MKDSKAKSLSASKAILTAAAIALFFGLGFVAPPDGLTKQSMQVLGIFCGTIILWLTIATDWPSFLCVAALIIIGITDAGDAFAIFLGNSTCAFLLFSYMLASALTETGVLKRFAIWCTTRKFIAGKPWVLLLMLIVAATLIGMVIIPSTMIIILLPVIEEIFEQCRISKRSVITETVVLCVAFAGSIAQGMTPIGHVHPLIAISLFEQKTGYAISYLDFMAFAIPVGILTIIVMFLYFRFIVKPDISDLQPECGVKKTGPMSKKEKISLAVLIFVLAGWIAPGIIKPFFPEAYAAMQLWSNVMPPMIGVIILALVKVENKPILIIGRAAKSVPWPVVFMLGATMVLSDALTSPSTGLTAWISNAVGSNIAGFSAMALLAAVVIWVIVQTNFSSNAVSVTLVFTVMMPVVMESDLLSAAATTAIIGSSACYAFATPMSTAVIAIACGTKWVKTNAAFKHGIVLMIVSVLMFILVGYPLATAIF